MLSSSPTLSYIIVIKAADTFVSQAQNIAVRVKNWVKATDARRSFLREVDGLSRKVKDIGQKAQKAQEAQEAQDAQDAQWIGEVTSAHLRRLCKEVASCLSKTYSIVDKNAQAEYPETPDESLFFDCLKELEQGWCSQKAFFYVCHMRARDQARGPVALSAVEADNVDFLHTLGEYANTFGSHPVSCFISYAEADGSDFASMLCKHLEHAKITAQTQDSLGPRVGRDCSAVDAAIQAADYVIVLGSKAYRDQGSCHTVLGRTKPVLRALVEGTVARSFPSGMNHARTGYADFRQAVNYHNEVFEVLKRLYVYADGSYPVFTPSVREADPV